MSQSKEEVVLGRLQELGLGVTVLATPPKEAEGAEPTGVEGQGAESGEVKGQEAGQSTEGAVISAGKLGLVGANAEETLARLVLVESKCIHWFQRGFIKTFPKFTFSTTNNCRFLLQVLGVTAVELSSRLASLVNPQHGTTCSFLSQELAHLLLYITHMFQSG